jgi:hypothetical protein
MRGPYAGGHTGCYPLGVGCLIYWACPVLALGNFIEVETQAWPAKPYDL